MKKGDVILRTWYSNHRGYRARVLGFGQGTVVIEWLEGPLAGREARVIR